MTDRDPLYHRHRYDVWSKPMLERYILHKQHYSTKLSTERTKLIFAQIIQAILTTPSLPWITV